MIKTLIIIVVVGLLVVSISLNLDTKKQSEQENQSLGEEINTANEIETDAPVEAKETKPTMVTASNSIDLSGQGLSRTPNYVFDLTDIQQLNLSNNNLDGALQAEIRHLQNLRVLDLSNNNFTGVPAEIGQLGKLEVLNLASNQLTGLPYELGNLSSLKILDLRGNSYSAQDLAVIRKNLSTEVVIKTD